MTEEDTNKAYKAYVLLGKAAVITQAIVKTDFENSVKAATINFFNGAGGAPLLSLGISPEAQTEFEKQLWDVFYPILLQTTEEYYKAHCAVIEQITQQIRESPAP